MRLSDIKLWILLRCMESGVEEFLNAMHDFALCLGLVNRFPQCSAVRNGVGEPGGKLLHLPNGARRLFFEQKLEVAFDQLVLGCDVRLCGCQPILQFLDLAKYPGIAERAPANHYAVATGLPLHAKRIFWCDNVPVSN